MAIEVFSFGQFAHYRGVIEWTGSNEADVLAYIRQVDGPDVPANAQWVIDSVSPTALTLSRPENHPAGYAMSIVIPSGWWIGVEDDGTAYPQVIDPAGKWKTTDIYGRPTDISELVVPPAE